MKKVVLPLLLFLGVFFCADSAQAATEVTAHITTPTVWTKAGSPYIVLNTIYIYAPLIIEPGVIVKLNNGSSPLNATLIVLNTFTATGTDSEKIIFTSLCDDNYGGDTRRYATRCYAAPIRGEWGGISIYDTESKVNIYNAKILYANRGISYQTAKKTTAYRGLVSVQNTEIRYSDSGMYIKNTVPLMRSLLLANNTIGLEVTTNLSDRVAQIVNSSILNNGRGIQALYSKYLVKIDASNNWWGDASGPYFYHADPQRANLQGKGNTIVGDGIIFRPWLESEPSFDIIPTCTENCFSNVMFLPGIKSSRLYKSGSLGTEDKLWIPNHFGNDVENLSLDGDGKSIEKVYTKADGALDEIAFPIIGGNIYKSFLSDLTNLKELGTINDYQSFAYDWRMNVEDIVRDGTPYDDGVMHSAVSDILKLAESSKSGKATIIAHSNGGLFAKALMMELEKQGKANRVDKIVFVGTPQMGTPLAMLSMLYGYDESALLGTLISREDARTFAENMPGAYGLLPSKKYFERIGSPFVNFVSERTRYKSFRDAYGDAIDSFGEFGKFLSGVGDNRSEPENADVEFENTLREKFLTQARETHERLDNWVPSSGVEVIQIAGWGLDTVSGIKYSEKEKVRCYSAGGKVPSCTGIGEYEPIYEPEFTVDGDEVVVAPSALMMTEATNVKRYWVDLNQYNEDNSDREHKNLLEIDSLRDFIITLVHNKIPVVSNVIRNSRPDDFDGARARLRMSLYSPLDIHLYDDDGHHTGPKKVLIEGEEQTVFEEGIPNSSYYQFGDRKYVGFGSGEHIRVEMEGYAEGSYTLKLEEVNPMEGGDEVISHTTFLNLPTTADTIVKLDIPETGLANLPLLKADMDGNGMDDYHVIPVPDGVAVLDITPPTTEVSLSGTQGADAWFMDDVRVTLSAGDDENGVGIERTEYSIDGGTTWIAYAEPLVISREGIQDILYFSTDKVGNKEEIQTVEVKVDKTAPEAKIAFNADTQKLDIIGIDNLGQNVRIDVSELVIPASEPESRKKHWYSWISGRDRGDEREGKKRIVLTATLTDEASHATVLSFEKKKDEKHRIDLKLVSVSYDGVKTELSEGGIQYKWQKDWRGRYRTLTSHLKIPSMSLESHYLSKKDTTIIMQKPFDDIDEVEDDEIDGRPIKEKLSGMIIPSIITEKGLVKIIY